MIAPRLQLLLLDALVDAEEELRGKVALLEDALQIGQPLFGRHAVLDVRRLVQISVQHDDGEGENEDGVAREYVPGVALFVAVGEGLH